MKHVTKLTLTLEWVGRVKDKRRLEQELETRLEQSLSQLFDNGGLTPDDWEGELLHCSYKTKKST